MPKNPAVTLKPLRGSARGRMLKALLLDRLDKQSVCRLDDVLRVMNTRYTPPMADHNAVLAVKQLVARGQIIRLAQGVYAAAGRKGDLLPRLEAAHPIAYAVYRAMDTRGTAPWPTRLIPDAVYRETDKKITKDQLYKALNVLEENGVVRWDKGAAALSKATARGAKLLGGALPYDVILSANAPMVADTVDAELDKDLRALRPTRSPDDDVIDPMAEELGGAHIDNDVGIFA